MISDNTSTQPSVDEVLVLINSLPHKTLLFPGVKTYYPLLNRLARGAHSILEVGIFQGCGACAMIYGNPVERYVGIDLATFMPNSLRHACENLAYLKERQAFEWRVEWSDSRWVDTTQLERFDLVYIDGDHSYECALHDFEKFWPLVNPGGKMLADDVLTAEHPGVAVAVEEFSKRHGLDVEVLAETVNGTAIWRKA